MKNHNPPMAQLTVISLKQFKAALEQMSRETPKVKKFKKRKVKND